MGDNELSEKDKEVRPKIRWSNPQTWQSIAMMVLSIAVCMTAISVMQMNAGDDTHYTVLKPMIPDEAKPITSPEPALTELYHEDYYFLERNISSNATIAITYNGSVLALVNISLEYELLEIESKYDNVTGTYDFKVHIVNFYLNITVTGPEFYGGVNVSIEELLYVTSGNDTMPTINEDMLMSILNIEPWGDYELE